MIRASKSRGEKIDMKFNTHPLNLALL